MIKANENVLFNTLNQFNIQYIISKFQKSINCLT